MNFDIIYVRNLRMEMAERKDAILIDIRMPDRYRKDHWEKAVNMPLELTESYERSLNKSYYYIFYCDHGGSSMKLARYLGKKGFKTATVIGGYQLMEKFKKGI